MNRRSLLQASACLGGAAVAGNAFIGKAAMAWFRGLTAPRWQLPLPAPLVVGAVFYVDIGFVLARSIDRRSLESRWCIRRTRCPPSRRHAVSAQGRRRLRDVNDLQDLGTAEAGDLHGSIGPRSCPPATGQDCGRAQTSATVPKMPQTPSWPCPPQPLRAAGLRAGRAGEPEHVEPLRTAEAQ